ncbi:ATP citrate lyase [Thecamonas trahens ATCC 50062]|uniref:ATP citrate synthase n=1 Tax=Thecamonas trahens ATCC 50062 TaxID=461836 RepID=A0A0L0DG56_THETB|nr:ATP citrate lyase [Thecamonas trahens ATCC 50062]KNC50333.1 ATP citrate lyase [Thecamonas trahens ATCC 50062]|eukprot:XP_013756879.1 ATP citrate lyase [Thecamonas trahens ATCC 50062]
MAATSSNAVPATDAPTWTNDTPLFSPTTRCLIYNPKPNPIQRQLDFDYLARRGAARGRHKVFFGSQEIFLDIFGNIADATAAHPEADVMLNFASQRSAAASTSEALDYPSIRTVVIIAEGVPEKETRKLIAKSKRLSKWIIGPATVGGIQAGAFKIGDTAGTVDNILACKLYRPGSVGFVSKSGGLSNECYNILSRTTNGLFEGIAIGGDAYPGSNFADHILRYQAMDQVKLIVMLGELGGDAEYDVVKLLKDGTITKPVVAWVSGTCATMFKTEVQFGHAGAKSGSEAESAQAKNAALAEAGAVVPTSFEGFEQAIADTYAKLAADGVVPAFDPNEPEPHVPPTMPVDYETFAAEGRVRRATGIVSTICDDRGEEPTYGGVAISDLMAAERGIGDAISLLWFKRDLPRWATRFIELVLVLCADHGPCVSGAHNTIVAARAGKDLVSCVASGLLTIGPRFGGAIDGAAQVFLDAHDRGLEPDEFVADMKRRGLRIPGIGHRIKSADNMDQRVKARNLVLNVDGAVANAFLDLWASSSSFGREEIKEMTQIGYLNGLFVVARSIGLVGHSLDQMRLKQPLYRHPWDDTAYYCE